MSGGFVLRTGRWNSCKGLDRAEAQYSIAEGGRKVWEGGKGGVCVSLCEASGPGSCKLAGVRACAHAWGHTCHQFIQLAWAEESE